MVYSTADDVKRIVQTNLTDPDIVKLIEESDAWIDKTLGAQSETDKLIRRLSMLKTAIVIRTRDPSSFSIGEYSEKEGRRSAAETWKEEIKEIVGLYLSPGSYEKASSYKTDEMAERWGETADN